MRSNDKIGRSAVQHVDDGVLSSGRKPKKGKAYLDKDGSINVVVTKNKNGTGYLEKNTFRKMML